MAARGSTVTVEDRRAVVIGGTSGIGRAIALAYADDGADVIATSRDEEKVADVAAELGERGATTAEVTCDVRDRASLEALCDVAFEELGAVDVLVNSAGSVARATVEDIEEEAFLRDVDVCLTGTFRAIQLFARRMEQGSVINVSSMSAFQSREERPGYCSAKAGLNGLTRAAAADLGPEIRVNAIAPGFVQTPITQGAFDPGTDLREKIDDRTPLARIAQPEEIAGIAVYLGSDASSFTTGEVVTVDGGYDNSAV